MINPSILFANHEPTQSDYVKGQLQSMLGGFNMFGGGQNQPQMGYMGQEEEYPTSAYPALGEKYQIPTGRARVGGTGESLEDILGARESSGNPKSINTLGFAGKFQFGAPALETVGFLKKGKGRLGNKAMRNPENWAIPGGFEAYLNNPALQDVAMKRLMASNEAALRKRGAITKDTPRNVINGLLASAHLSGVGGAIKAMKGIPVRDAYGTSNIDYYRMGMRAR